MYCSKCGNECSDNVMFCSRCGNPVNDAGSFSIPEENQANPDRPVAVEQKKNSIINKRMLAVVLSAIVVIVAAIFLIAGSNKSNRSPEKLSETFVKAYNGLDAKGVVSCYPDFLVKRVADSLGISSASRGEVAKALQESINASGEVKRNAQIISVVVDRELSTDYDLFDMYGVSSSEKNNISEVLDLDVTYVLDNNTDTDHLEIICFKENNRWYVLDID